MYTVTFDDIEYGRVADLIKRERANRVRRANAARKRGDHEGAYRHVCEAAVMVDALARMGSAVDPIDDSEAGWIEHHGPRH